MLGQPGGNNNGNAVKQAEQTASGEAGRRHPSAARSESVLASSWLMALYAAMLVAGCAGGSSPSNNTTAPSSSSASQSAQRAVQSPIPSGSHLTRNATTVYTGCSDQKVSDPFEPTAQLFDPASGKNVILPRPPIAPTDQLLSHACTVTTLADGRQRVIYLMTIKTPSQGLTPEAEQTELVAMDPSSANPVTIKPFPLPADNNWYLYPATNGFSVAHTLGGTSIHETITDVAFFDANSLEITAQAHPDGDHPLDGVNYDGYVTLDGTNAHIFSGADGSEVGFLPNADGLLYPVDHGFLLQHSPGAEPGVEYFDMASKSLTGPIAPFLDGNGAFDPGLEDVNVYGDTVLLADATFKHHIVVFDMAATKVLFSLDEAKLAGLTITGARLGDHHLYLTNDSDNPVIDYRTSQRVSSGWNIIPATKLADGWVYVHSGTPQSIEGEGCTIGSFGVSCSGANTSADKVARGATGDYDGPWY